MWQVANDLDDPDVSMLGMYQYRIRTKNGTIRQGLKARLVHTLPMPIIYFSFFAFFHFSTNCNCGPCGKRVNTLD